MAVFAIYAASSPNRPSLSQQAEAVVVREGFSFWAFLMPFVWCAYHRAWRPLGALVVALGLLVDDADLTPDYIGREVVGLLTDDARLQAMTAAAATVGHRDAARRVAEVALEVARAGRRAGR